MPSLRGISENVVAGLIVLVIAAVASGLLSLLDASVPLWVVPAVATVFAGGAFLLGQLSGLGEDLASYHADHVGEVILTFQQFLAGKLPGISVADLIERGILGPARFGLTTVPGEDIRLAVLVPTEPEKREFRMAFEAGHSVGRKQDFRMEIAGSLAGYAFSTGQLEWSNDVDRDPRWRPHPKASPRRAYGSLAAVPVLVGDDVVAVLNVLSTRKGAFLKGDLTYIELLRVLIGLAWALPGNPPAASSTLAASQESRPDARKGEE